MSTSILWLARGACGRLLHLVSLDVGLMRGILPARDSSEGRMLLLRVSGAGGCIGDLEMVQWSTTR